MAIGDPVEPQEDLRRLQRRHGVHQRAQQRVPLAVAQLAVDGGADVHLGFWGLGFRGSGSGSCGDVSAHQTPVVAGVPAYRMQVGLRVCRAVRDAPALLSTEFQGTSLSAKLIERCERRWRRPRS